MFAILLVNYAKSQVGFNNPSPDASSVVDIKASDRGILIPRLTTAERAAMLVSGVVPADGLLVFDKDLNRFYFCYSSGPNKKWLAVNPWITEDEGGNPTPVKDMYTLVTGNTGVATSTPKSKLAVQGNLAVGSSYAGANSAPVNGAIIEGNVAIGKTTAATALDVNGVIQSTGFSSDVSNTAAGVSGPVPSGGIIMWSGSIASIPTGWALCNGLNGTPDLRERFIVGAGGANTTSIVNGSTGGYPIGVGTNSGENSHSLTVSEMPSHSHTTTQLPHSHKYSSTWGYGGPIGTFDDKYENPDSQNFQNRWNYSSEETISITVNDNGGGQAHENRPPYFALAFIIKL